MTSRRDSLTGQLGASAQRARKAALEAARASRVYGFWRRGREFQQVARYDAFLETLRQEGPVYSLDALTEGLRTLRPSRRSIGSDGELRVLAYGALDWEAYGLWQELAKLGRFELFNISRNSTRKASSSDLGREFLERLSMFERAYGDAHLVYFYAGGMDLDPALLRELRSRGIWTALMGLDDKQQLGPLAHPSQDGAQLDVAHEADLYWTTWRTGADWLVQRNVRAWYAGPGASSQFFAPRRVPKDLDVVWIGRAYGPRLELVRYLQEHNVPVTAYGPGWPAGMLPFEKMVDVFSQAKIVLGMGGVGQTDRFKHLKGRDIEVPMCGAAYLTNFNHELSDLFEIGKEILCYGSREECRDVLAWALARPAMTEAIGAAARARCLKEHSWEARFLEIADLFGLRRTIAGGSGSPSL